MYIEIKMKVRKTELDFLLLELVNTEIGELSMPAGGA